MTRHVQSFHFIPFLNTQDFEKVIRTYAHDDPHFVQTLTIFQLFYLINHIHLHPNEIKTRGHGASAQLYFPSWVIGTDLLFFFSPNVCLRVKISDFFEKRNEMNQQRIGILEMYKNPFIFISSVVPSTMITLYAIKSERPMADIIMGLIFWFQHEYTMINMYAYLQRREHLLHRFIRLIHSEHQVLVKNTHLKTIQSKTAGAFLRNIKTCFQNELRENDFLKQTLKYFRTWPTLNRLSPRVRDRSQTKARHLHRLFEFQNNLLSA